MKQETEKNKFVANGGCRAWKAHIGQVRSDVEGRYAEELAKAGFWNKLRLRLRIRREIKRRMDKAAPPDALYLKNR